MVLTLSPAKYGKLLSKTLPKRIDHDAEFDHFVETMEKLSRAIERQEASPEEQALHSLSFAPHQGIRRSHPAPAPAGSAPHAPIPHGSTGIAARGPHTHFWRALHRIAGSQRQAGTQQNAHLQAC